MTDLPRQISELGFPISLSVQEASATSSKYRCWRKRTSIRHIPVVESRRLYLCISQETVSLEPCRPTHMICPAHIPWPLQICLGDGVWGGNLKLDVDGNSHTKQRIKQRAKCESCRLTHVEALRCVDARDSRCEHWNYRPRVRTKLPACSVERVSPQPSGCGPARQYRLTRLPNWPTWRRISTPRTDHVSQAAWKVQEEMTYRFRSCCPARYAPLHKSH